MPVYFLYGFRWPRPGHMGVRAFTTLNNLEDCSSEYVQNEPSKMAILQVLRDQHAHIMHRLEDKDTGRTLDFIEQYDPQDESSDSAASQPHVFVAAHVVTIAAGASFASAVVGKKSEQESDITPPSTANSRSAAASSPASPTVRDPLKRPSTASSHPNAVGAALSLDVEDVMAKGPGITSDARKALAELRDKVAEGEKIGWWVVYNGDPERAFSDYEEDEEDEDSVAEVDNSAFVEDDGPDTPTGIGSLAEGSLLGQPMPSLIPQELKDVITVKGSSESTEHVRDPSLQDPEKQTSDPPVNTNIPKTEDVPLARPKGSKSSFSGNFSFPLRRKSSKVAMPQPKNDDVPDPATLKDINKKEGRRYKFFGGRSEKKAT